MLTPLELLSELEFLDLARAGQRPGIDPDPMLGSLLRRQALADERFELGRLGAAAAARAHEAGDLLAIDRARHADDGGLGDVVMLEHRILDLDREQILAAAD